MGLRTRIKEKLKARLQDILALVNVIHDEAKHPGRPQPHMAARNPLYGGEEQVPNSNSTSTSTSTSDSKTSASQNHQPAQEPKPATPDGTKDTKLKNEGKGLDKDKSDDDFWYLRGDDEGWSDLNPGKTEDN